MQLFLYPNEASEKKITAIDPLVAEIFMFESVNTQTDGQTHGRRLDGYTISSPCEPLAQVS